MHHFVSAFLAFLFATIFCDCLPTPFFSALKLDTNENSQKRLVGYWEDGLDHNINLLNNFARVVFFLNTDHACNIISPEQAKIDYIHSAGTRVIGRIGGHGMATILQSCSIDFLANQLVDIIRTTTMDGIDIDYQNDQPNSTFAINLVRSYLFICLFVFVSFYFFYLVVYTI